MSYLGQLNLVIPRVSATPKNYINNNIKYNTFGIIFIYILFIIKNYYIKIIYTVLYIL